MGRKGTNTKTEEHTSALGRVADPVFFADPDPDPDPADFKYMDLDQDPASLNIDQKDNILF